MSGSKAVGVLEGDGSAASTSSRGKTTQLVSPKPPIASKDKVAAKAPSKPVDPVHLQALVEASDRLFPRQGDLRGRLAAASEGQHAEQAAADILARLVVVSAALGKRVSTKPGRSLKQEIDARDALISKLESDIKTIRRSFSWRASAPLRMVSRRMRSIHGDYWQARIQLVDRLRRMRQGPTRRATPWRTGRTFSRSLRIVAIGDGPIPSITLTFDHSLKAAAAAVGAGLEIFYENAPPADDVLANADIVFMMRACSPEAVRLAEVCAAAGTPLIYLLDDDFSALDPETPLGRRYQEFGAEANIVRLTQLAELTVAWSRPFARKLARTARRVEVFNAVANLEIFAALPRAKPSRGPGLRFGYAGGTTHGADLALIRKPILDYLARHPDAKFESIGLEIEWLLDHPQYQFFPGNADMVAYYRSVVARGWDFAIAPLRDTVFNAAKSDNKYREYSAAGIPAVYSRTAAYKTTIQDAENGLLADGDAEWTEALERITRDEQLRADITRVAREDVNARCSRPRVAEQYAQTITEQVAQYNVLGVGPLRLPTFAIDVDAPFRLLGEQRQARLRRREIVDVTAKDLEWADTLVIVRAIEPEYLALVRRARAKGVKVVFSWDDNWLDFPHDDTPLSRHIHAPVNQASMQAILREADVIKASTPLIEAASRKFNANVVRYAYGFDFDLVEGEPRFRRDGRIRVGYFGTPGRDGQFDFVIEALKLVQSRIDNIDIEFLGFTPARVGELKNVRHLPFLADYQSSVRVLDNRRWDIGLSPLVDMPFNRAKLPTKYRDYAATGAVGIYSRLPIYEDVVADHQTGVLLENDHQDWAAAIEQLATQQSLRESMAMAAYRHVRRNLSAERAAQDWLRILEQLHSR